MKAQLFTIVLFLGIAIGFFLAKILNLDSQKTAEKSFIIHTDTTAVNSRTTWPWADSLDATKAAPQNHRVLFENDNIRILEVILKPYEFEPLHTHRFPSVYVRRRQRKYHKRCK